MYRIEGASLGCVVRQLSLRVHSINLAIEHAAVSQFLVHPAVSASRATLALSSLWMFNRWHRGPIIDQRNLMDCALEYGTVLRLCACSTTCMLCVRAMIRRRSKLISLRRQQSKQQRC